MLDQSVRLAHLLVTLMVVLVRGERIRSVSGSLWEKVNGISGAYFVCSIGLLVSF